MSTYYDILRVPEDAGDKEIKAAYRQAALAYHPDHMPKGVSKRMRDDAAQTWLEIQEAFSVLSDPAKREEYDTLLEEMRQAEEIEGQFEPAAPPPPPQKPKPTPSPTPQETAQQPAPQRRLITRIKRAWLWVCFQAGRHWRKVCFVATVVLFIANGVRDSETWTVMSVAIIFTTIMAAFSIAAASGQSWKDKRRYIVNAATVIALSITGITALTIPTAPPPQRSAPLAASHPATPAAPPIPTATVPGKTLASEASAATTQPNKLVETAPTTKSSELLNAQPPTQNNPITATAKDSATASIIPSKDPSYAARAAYFVLRGGERVHVIGYQPLGDKYRLQLNGGWMEVSTSDVVSIEPEPSTEPTAMSVNKTWKNLRDGQTYRTHLDGDTFYLESTVPYPKRAGNIANCKFHRAISVGLAWAGECWEINSKDQSIYRSDATITTISETRIDMGTGDMTLFAMIPADGTSNTAPQDSTSAMNQAQQSSSPTMPTSRQESASPANGATPAQRDMSTLTGPETESIESACSHAKYLEGPASYNRCLQSQLAALAATPARPDLSNLSDAEQQSIESACSHAKYLEGPAVYNRCLRAQLAALGNVSSRPDLSRLNGPEQQSIESACSHAKYLEGPAAYNRCLRNQLAELANAPRRPDLSGLSGAEQQSIESACSHAKFLEGPAAYNRCLKTQLDMLRNSR